MSTEIDQTKENAISPEVSAMLKEAAMSAGEAETSSIPFISLRGKVFKMDDVKLGTELSCVILATVMEHAWYDRPYDPKSEEVFPPACFAMGASSADLVPDETSPAKQADSCSGCEKNEFGSSSNGKGKACRNGRRLLIASMSNGKVNLKDLAIINISPTALKGFSRYIKSIATLKQVPIWAVQTKLSFEEDSAYPKVLATFESVLSAEDIGLISKNIMTYDKDVSVTYDVSQYEAPTKVNDSKKSKMS